MLKYIMVLALSLVAVAVFGQDSTAVEPGISGSSIWSNLLKPETITIILGLLGILGFLVTRLTKARAAVASVLALLDTVLAAAKDGKVDETEFQAMATSAKQVAENFKAIFAKEIKK
jgi:hypothetical protein